MKIIAFTPVYKRHGILEIWLEGIKRISKIADIKPVVMVSLREDLEWMLNHKDKDFDPIIVTCNNNPLSDKQNIGLDTIRDMDWDYICQISSDLLLTNKGLLALMDNPADVTGFTMAYFIDTIWDRAILFEKRSAHKTIGACRLISREIISGLDYKLWSNGLNRNLDGDSQQRMEGATFKIINEPLVVGLKSSQQLTPFRKLLAKSEEIDIREAVEGLSEAEIELMKQL